MIEKSARFLGEGGGYIGVFYGGIGNYLLLILGTLLRE